MDKKLFKYNRILTCFVRSGVLFGIIFHYFLSVSVYAQFTDQGKYNKFDNMIRDKLIIKLERASQTIETGIIIGVTGFIVGMTGELIVACLKDQINCFDPIPNGIYIGAAMQLIGGLGALTGLTFCITGSFRQRAIKLELLRYDNSDITGLKIEFYF